MDVAIAGVLLCLSSLAVVKLLAWTGFRFGTWMILEA